MDLHETIDQCIRNGDFYYSMGQYQEALRLYDKGLAMDHRNVILQTKKANTLLMLRKTTDAYYGYLSSLFNANMLDLLDQFVKQDHVYIHDDIVQLFELLNYKYKIPIIQEGLRVVLDRIQDELDESHRLKIWKRFEKKLDQKNFNFLEEMVDAFLKEFGEKYYIHFLSFYCYLGRYKDPNLSSHRLIDIINKQIKMRELEQFERLLKRGVRKKAKSLDRMSGIEFENYLAIFFESCGYQVQKTKASHDQGADLILSKFGKTIAVQAKRQKRPVGTTSIQQVVTAQRVHHTESARVIITSSFTKPAVTLAKELGVELWDRTRLLNEINKSRYDVFETPV